MINKWAAVLAHRLRVRLVNGLGVEQSLRSPTRRGILPLLARAAPNRSASLPQYCRYLIVASVISLPYVQRRRRQSMRVYY